MLLIHLGFRLLQGRVSRFSGSRHTPVAHDIIQRDVREDESNTILHAERPKVTIENDGQMSTFIKLSYTAKPIPNKTNNTMIYKSNGQILIRPR